MTRLSLLIGCLLLVGCAEPAPYVLVTTEYREQMTFCDEIHCRITDGKCDLGDARNCVKAHTGTGVTVEPLIMSPEEFSFRYENDPEFKASVRSYEYR